MSRVFKPKPKMQWTESEKELAVKQGMEKPGGKTSSMDVGVTVVEKTPVKPRARFSSNPIPGTSTIGGESTEGDWSISFDVP